MFTVYNYAQFRVSKLNILKVLSFKGLTWQYIDHNMLIEVSLWLYFSFQDFFLSFFIVQKSTLFLYNYIKQYIFANSLKD